ncbi:phospholipase D-like domain-containing protein [Sphingobacterium sp.]|uniref:phospholipase D-like domain-containing protein n=1 Tax=Sphingobacterium sp. TaxID=341027 RepID=UPI00289CF2E1|nr:phospholipase D-like domain-containing protein [Sphingobacterium sp.]
MSDLITDGSEIKNRIILEIKGAKQSVLLAMAWFTDRDIATAMIEAKNRNVYVDVILSSNEQNETVKDMLVEANIAVHAFETGDSRGIMHHKFILIDNRLTINGSYNYSYNASKNNIENVSISYDTALYSKFLAEFERLRHNIDNKLELNRIYNDQSENNISTNEPKMQPLNIIDSFSDQLNSLVYSAIDLNTDNYRDKGYENARESTGNLDIFRTEYNSIKEKIRSYATDEGLGSKKNLLMSNISMAYESEKISLNIERDDKLLNEKRKNDLEKLSIQGKLEEAREKKSKLESGDKITGEKGILQINMEIEQNKLEKSTLEQSVVLQKFWTPGTIMAVIALGLLSIYLSIFFGSAVFKSFFEANEIRNALETTGNASIPPIVDANAIGKMFTNYGFAFGFVGMLFFLVPVLISNIKIFGSKDKRLSILMFLIGIVVFDVIVSIMITMTTAEVKALVNGEQSDTKIYQAFLHAEFWLIFAFGMLPLIIVHHIIDYLTNVYKKSQRDIVDANTNSRILFLDKQLIDLNMEKEILFSKIGHTNSVIEGHILAMENLDMELNSIQTQIATLYSDYQKNIKSIFDDYYARITSGKMFTEMILDSVVSAYKSGFVAFLPEYFAPDEVAKRVREIEQTTLRIVA